MASLCGYSENHDMEQLAQKLLCTTLELEKLKAESMEEMKRNKQCISQLILLVKYSIQERDEAIIQLQKLLTKATYLTASEDVFPSIPLSQSNSLSETYNYRSQCSPVESVFKTVSSPEFLVHESRAFPASRLDQESLVIDNLAMRRALPQKGKLLQAVLQAGPIIQTLLVAGPLPRWRNPPQLQLIPPASTNGGGFDVYSNKPLSNVSQLSAPSANLQNYGQLSCGSSHDQTAPMLSSRSMAAPNCLSNAPLMNTQGYRTLAKRQRFC